MILDGAGPRRWAGGAALALLVAVLLVDLGKLVATAASAIGYPYDLDYGEGIVWQQMDAIVAGRGYAPLVAFPAIVFHYPPVYHLTVAAAAALTGGDALAVGRAVSLAATIVAATLVGVLAAAAADARDRRARAIGAAVGALVFAASPTVIAWAPLMRVDMLATALTLAGLAMTARTLARPDRLPIAEAVLFVLAVYTKQTAIIGPAAAFAALWLVRRETAWRFAALCGSLAAAALIAAMAATHGEFLRHIVAYNVNRIDPARWRPLAKALATQATPIAVALATASGARHGLTRRPTLLLLTLYLVARLAALPMSLKSGAEDNYLIDLFSVAAALTGVAASAVATAILADGRWPRPPVTLLLLVALPVAASRVGMAQPAARDAGWRADAATMVERIRAAPRPVVSDFMVLIRRAGRPVLLEPAIVAELAHSHLYDEAAFVALIRRGAFAFFLTEGDGARYAERYNPAVRAAIAAAYPRVERHGEMVLHLPAGLPSRADRAASPPR